MPNPVREIDTVHAERSTARRQALAALEDAIAKVRYGSVQVTVHDGRIVQLDVTERQRFT